MRQKNNPLKSALGLAVVAGLAFSNSAMAEKSAEEGIQEYRDMLADGNPAELMEMEGEELFAKKQGPKNASFEKCDFGLGPGVLKGAVAQMPRYFKDTNSVMDVENRLLYCADKLQGRKKDDWAKKPFAGRGQPTTEMEALIAYIYAQSRGETINLPQKHAMEKAAYARGEKIFFYRGGPYDFSCASCHGVDGQRIRLQGLPNLTKPEPAQRAFAQWPAYRVSFGGIRTMQWRVYDCFRQQRFPALKYGSEASIDLITFLGVKAKGGTMEATALKR